MARAGPATLDGVQSWRSIQTLTALAFAACFLFIGSMGMAVADEIVPIGITQEELFGTMLRSSKWKKMPIGVCWENPSDSNADKRAIVRHAVEETWVAHSAISFTGWDDTCAEK